MGELSVELNSPKQNVQHMKWLKDAREGTAIILLWPGNTRFMKTFRLAGRLGHAEQPCGTERTKVALALPVHLVAPGTSTPHMH